MRECTAKCCGPIPVSEGRWAKIQTYLETVPEAEKARLRAQKRGKLDCGFLDMETYRCGIYPVRPWVCWAFGRVERARCPMVTEIKNPIPKLMQRIGFEDEYPGLPDQLVIDSCTFKW